MSSYGKITKQELHPNLVQEIESGSSTEVNELKNDVLAINNQLTQADKFIRDISINVKMFGAIGDGITDDTIAIENALNYISFNGGGKIYFPFGIYLVSRTLKLVGNTLLEGSGRRASLIRLKDNSNCNVLETYDDGQQRYYLHIKDIGIDGNAQNQLSGSDSNGIVITNMNECTVENIGIWNPRKSGLVVNGTGDLMSTVPMIKHPLIRGDVLHTEGDGIELTYGSYDGIITGCDVGFFKSGAGIKMTGHNGATLSDSNLWQNRFGMYMDGTNRTRLSNMLSDYANRYGFFSNNCHDTQWVGCQSRMSSIENKETYDGFHFLACHNVQMTNPKVISAERGSTYYLDGETAFGIAMSYCQNFGIVNLQSNAIKGRYFTENCSNIFETQMNAVS